MLAKKGLEQGSRRAEITELQRDGGNRVLRVSSNCLLISRSQLSNTQSGPQGVLVSILSSVAPNLGNTRDSGRIRPT